MCHDTLRHISARCVSEGSVTRNNAGTDLAVVFSRGATMRTKLIVAAILLSGVYGLLTAVAVSFGL